MKAMAWYWCGYSVSDRSTTGAAEPLYSLGESLSKPYQEYLDTSEAGYCIFPWVYQGAEKGGSSAKKKGIATLKPTLSIAIEKLAHTLSIMFDSYLLLFVTILCPRPGLRVFQQPAIDLRVSQARSFNSLTVSRKPVRAEPFGKLRTGLSKHVGRRIVHGSTGSPRTTRYRLHHPYFLGKALPSW